MSSGWIWCFGINGLVVLHLTWGFSTPLVLNMYSPYSPYPIRNLWLCLDIHTPNYIPRNERRDKFKVEMLPVVDIIFLWRTFRTYSWGEVNREFMGLTDSPTLLAFGFLHFHSCTPWVELQRLKWLVKTWWQFSPISSSLIVDKFSISAILA